MSGRAGIGKSRLVEWIAERAHETGAAIVLKATHSPISTPAHGIPRMLQGLFGGLGQMLINSKFNFRYPRLYAALIVSSLLSIAIFLFFSWTAERLFAAWHESEQS